MSIGYYENRIRQLERELFELKFKKINVSRVFKVKENNELELLKIKDQRTDMNYSIVVFVE